MKSIIDTIRQSLSLKLSIKLLLFVMTVFVVSLGFQFYYSRSILQQDVKKRAFYTLHNTSLSVTRLLNEVETATHNAEWLVLSHIKPDSLLTYSRRITEQNPNVNSCSISLEPDIFPQYGRHFSAYSVRFGDSIVTMREAAYDYFGKVWYRKPRNLGKPCWIDPFYDTGEGGLTATDMIASYCVALYNAQKEFIGVLSSDISLPKLSKTICEQKPYPHSYFFMLGESGYFFVHPDTSLLAKRTIFNSVNPEKHKDVIALGHEMMQRETGVMEVNIDNQDCLVFYQPQPNTSWSLALVCPKDDIFGDYYTFYHIGMMVIAIGLAFLLLLCRRAVNNHIEPLNALSKMARSISEGHFDINVLSCSNNDDVGQLQNSFAKMQHSILTHINNIRETNAQTEKSIEKLTKAQLLAEQSQKKKATFVQNMTHQIRTPLNIILGFSQVMLDNYHEIPSEELGSLNDMIDHNTVVINRMILMLIDAAQLDKDGSFTLDDIVSCNGVAYDAIKCVCHVYPDIDLTLESSLPDSITTRTNYLYLLRSIRELLYNSAKYASGKKATVKVESSATKIYYTIEDIGEGISEDGLDSMFDIFVKVDDFTEGLGLGLPLTKQHIKKLGGDLVFDTSYKKGCRFIIDIPRID